MIVEILLLFFASMDVLLTYYQFDIDKKNNCLNMNAERNWLPRKLINGKPTVLKALLHSLLQVTIFTIIIILFNNYISTITFRFPMIPFLTGAIFMVNMYHLDNLATTIKNKEDKEFWDIRKKYVEKL